MARTHTSHAHTHTHTHTHIHIHTNKHTHTLRYIHVHLEKHIEYVVVRFTIISYLHVYLVVYTMQISKQIPIAHSLIADLFCPLTQLKIKSVAYSSQSPLDFCN